MKINLESIRVNERGFSHVMIVVFVLLVAVVGGVGYRVQHMSHASAIGVTVTGLANKCLDNKWNRVVKGNPVQLYVCNGTNAQKWNLNDNGTITNQGLCIDVPGASKKAGTNLQLYTCNNTVAQVWKQQSDGTIRNPNAGMCITVEGGDSANWTPVEINVCTGSPSQIWKPSSPTAANNTPPPTANCTNVLSNLSAPCRPLIGEAANNYTEVGSDTKSQVLYAEKRTGHTLDLVHTYHPVGSNHLNSAETYFASQPGTTLFVNWKPASTWATAGGSANNAAIDSMASSVKSLGSKKIFMTIWHEPENDVSPGGDANCPNLGYKGSAGTVAQYRTMWAYTTARFKADGVTNVIWALDYMNYPKWDCLVPDLYPGNHVVDWVVFNGYADSATATFPGEVGRFYNLLTSKNDSSHNYLSKPWGIVEWGMDDRGTCTQQEAYYDSAKQTITSNSFPKLKLYMAFDERDKGDPNGNDIRTGYCQGAASQIEQSHYNGFVDAALSKRF